LLALPAMLRLTGATNAMPAPNASLAPAAPPAIANVQLELTFAHAPVSFSVLYLGKPIWEGEQPGTVARKELPIPFPAEGVDLELKASWPAGTPETAVRMAVTPKDQPPITQSAWGSGQLDRVLTFQESTQ
jgi:hypothetical protein